MIYSAALKARIFHGNFIVIVITMLVKLILISRYLFVYACSLFRLKMIKLFPAFSISYVPLNV